MLSRQHRFDAETSYDDTVFKSADYTLTTRDSTVVVDSSDAAVTITLPPVAEAKGLIFVIEAPYGASNAVTVQDQDDSVNWTNVTDLDANNDALCVMSNGRRWIEIQQKEN